MEILRTPEKAFANLKDYPYEPHYTIISTHDNSELRIHHIDVGPEDGPIILCMHGQPVWSYLYTKMIPFFSLKLFTLSTTSKGTSGLYGSPVFPMATLLKRSGSFATILNPINPPQS